jgi:hypothetical protein
VQNISRRTFLVSTAGLALVACSGGGDDDDGQSAGSGSSDSAGVDLPSDAVLVFRQDTSALLMGRPQRLVFAVTNADGSRFNGGPDTLDLEITTLDDAPIGEATGTRHDVDGQVYWSAVATMPAEDNYVLKVTGTQLVAAFTARDKAVIPIPAVGDLLVAVDTPTTADGRGVDPICTREPACPFHEVNLNEALAGSLPVVLLIGTPAYCQTGVCGPVLDHLIEVVDGDALAGKATVIHAEVYSTRWDGADAPPVTEAVNAFELSFEPVLYVATPGGEIVARLDAVWDQAELREALALAIA